jgi:hypothetical protein
MQKILERNTEMFEERMMPEVDEETEAKIGGFQVIPHLGLMLAGEVAQCLQFDDDLIIADEIRLVNLFQNPPLIDEVELLLGYEWNASLGELDLQAFLIDRLQEPAAHDLVNLEARADDFIGFLLVKNVSH